MSGWVGGLLGLLLWFRRRGTGLLAAMLLTACTAAPPVDETVGQIAAPLTSKAEFGVEAPIYVNAPLGNDADVKLATYGHGLAESFLAVWRHQLPSGRWRALARDAYADPQDPPLVIADGVAPQALDMATGKNHVLVVWQDEFGNIVARRLDPKEKKLVDVGPVQIGYSHAKTNVAVAHDEMQWLVVWVESGVTGMKVVARTIMDDELKNLSVEPQPSDAATQVSPNFESAGQQQTVRVDWFAPPMPSPFESQWVVAWHEAKRRVSACWLPKLEELKKPCTSFPLTDHSLGPGFALAAGEGAVFAAWNSTRKNLVDVFYHDGGNGEWWAVGSEGLIIRSPDRENWTVEASGTYRGLHGVHFLSSGVGIAVGNGGTILRKEPSDPIPAWTPAALPPGFSANLYDVHFNADGSIGYAVGAGGTILTTKVGGQSWEVQDTPTNSWLSAVHVHTTDKNVTWAWAVGSGIILRKKGDEDWKAVSM
ncbi:MAG: hypothetical protein VB934_17555, partial [Polyangiaceae bacterium]